MSRRRRVTPPTPPLSALPGVRFPPEAIMLAVRWHLGNGLSDRDLESGSPNAA